MLRASQALFYFADELLDRYDRLQSAHEALVDFGDLICRAANLLTRAESRDWIRYKLDRGIDHVLIDEAQDTSREQWAHRQRDHARNSSPAKVRRMRQRTVFAVGDEKQSIFSFQGAAPAMFAEQAEKLSPGREGSGCQVRACPAASVVSFVSGHSGCGRPRLRKPRQRARAGC